MGRSRWLVAGVVLLGLLIWGLAGLGAFRSPEDLDEAAGDVDPGVLGEPPFEPEGQGGEEGDREQARAPQRGDHSLALSGRASVVLSDFAMNDKQGREVLRVERMEGHFDVTALRRGVYRMRKASVQGIEVTLYRDATGQVSLTHALGETPPPVRQGLHLPPEKKPEEDPWLLEIGPVDVRDATLTLGFTEKPVQFHVEHAKIMVRRRAKDDGPMIYIEDVHGTMTKPKPLPKPVRIAYANGLVKLAGEPLVDLTARTCIGRDELRAHAVVPARQEAVTMTVDSQGLVGALGRMGLKIASRRESEKLHYVHKPVKIEGGPGCRDKDADPAKDAEAQTDDSAANSSPNKGSRSSEARDAKGAKGGAEAHDAKGAKGGAEADEAKDAKAGPEAREERREERKERRKE
ncbi:MAG: hypothetical protein AAGF92_11300 [Myxococcota bacterium]